MILFDRRLVLLATPRHIGVLDWRPGHMHWLGEFAADEAGLAAFHAVVARHARRPTLVVVDTVDEDYRSEILPHVRGQARDEMVQRKLRQVFRNARFTGAWRQSRETSGRRDDRYLLAALTDADWLAPWLAVLQRERVPLYGITPLAMASQHLLAKLRPQAPHVLLAHRLDSRLRLSYYHDGLLRFSRLASSEAPAQQSGNAADEIAKTQLYLTGQRILPREARLHVLLLDLGGQLDRVQAQLNADPAFSTRVVDLATLSHALRIPDSFLTSTPEIAPLAAIASEPVALNLAPAELLQPHVEYRWRQGLGRLAIGVGLAGCLATAGFWLNAQSLRNDAYALAAQRQQLETRHQAIRRDFPSQLAAPEQIAQTVRLAALLTSQPIDVSALLAALGQVLAAYPDLRLDGLAWNDDFPASPGQATVRLEVALANFDGNYRAAMQRIESLMRALETHPALNAVTLRASPVNTSADSTLSGRTEATGGQLAVFGVELRYQEARP